MLTLNLTPDLVAGFAAVATHASTDTVTPILNTVRVDQSHLVATDRYTIGQYRHTDPGENLPEFSALIPLEIAAWVGKYRLGRGDHTIDITDQEAAIHTPGGGIETRGFAPVYGNYPPVERLIVEPDPGASHDGPFNLSPLTLTKLSKCGIALGKPTKARGGLPVQFTLNVTEGAKPAPIYCRIGDRFVALVQPVSAL